MKVARAVAAVVIVALIGFALARAGRGGSSSGDKTPTQPTLSGHAATTAFAVNYPADWRQLSGPPSGLVPALAKPVSLAPDKPGQELIIGTAPAAASPGALPASVRVALDTQPKPDLVELGNARFSRYLNLKPRGQGITETVYLLSTTSGTIGAVCAAQAASSTLVGDCERVLGTLKLTSGSALAPGADTRYAARLNQIMATLNDVRRSSGPGLQSGPLKARAQSALILANAHAAASKAIARLTPSGSGLVKASRRVATVLAQTSAQYQALGVAITKRRNGAYRTASGRLNSSARTLAAAYAQLSRFGFRVG
jgi:hypothetical protein